ncbi:MAG: Hpt domain-containing protein [Gammaproteobacteria bacterium]|nr:Hpt domain-containing protein [Gammaproteobacteria bacterium]
MTEYTLDKETFDQLRDIMGDDIPAFVNTYLEHSPGVIQAIEAAISSGDADDTFLQAHRLKGGSASIGAAKLASLAFDMEQAGRTGTMQGMEQRLGQLKDEYQRVEAALKAELDNGQPDI